MTRLTQQRLKELFSYDMESGLFTRIGYCRGQSYGAQAGHLNKEGYIRMRVDGMHYLAHRLAWLYVNGDMPPGVIDHINHCRSDNRIANLRVVDVSTNTRHQLVYRNNKSGIPGIHWRERKKKWRVQIGICGRRVCIGDFADIEDAKAARIEAKATYHANAIPALMAQEEPK